MNAACLNKNLECLGLLVRHGGSLGKVSTLQTESAIESARLTRHKKLIKFVSHLTNKDLTDDRRDFLEPTGEDGQEVIFFNLVKTLFVLSLTSSGISNAFPLHLACVQTPTPLQQIPLSLFEREGGGCTDINIYLYLLGGRQQPFLSRVVSCCASNNR